MSQDPNINSQQYRLEHKQQVDNQTDSVQQKPSAGENIIIIDELKAIKKVLGYKDIHLTANVDDNNVRRYLQNIMFVLGYPGISNNSIVVSLQQRLENIEKKLPNNNLNESNENSKLIKDTLTGFNKFVIQKNLEPKIDSILILTSKEGDLYKKLLEQDAKLSQENTNIKIINDNLEKLNNYAFKLNQSIYKKIENVEFATQGEYSQTFQNISNYLANQIPNLKTFNDSINNIILKFDNLTTQQQATQITTAVGEIKTTLIQQHGQLQTKVEQIKQQVDSSLNQSTKQLTDDISKITQSVNTNLSTLNSTLQKSASAIELEKTQGLINRDVVAPLKQLNEKQSEFNNTQQSILNILDERLRKPVEHANPDEETILEMADYGVRILEELTSMARSYAKNKDTINGNQQQIQQTKQQLETEKQNAVKQAQREIEKNIINNYINFYGSMNDLDSIYDNPLHSKFIQQYIKRDTTIYKNNPNLLSIDNNNTSKINNSHSIKNQFKVLNSCFYNNFGEIIQWATVVEAENLVTQPNSKSTSSSSSDNLGY